MDTVGARVRSLTRLPGATAAVWFPMVACLLLPGAGLAVVAVSAQVASGDWRQYPVLATNHLLTLGWGTLVAAGALHQMFPAVLGVSAKPGRAAAVHLAVTAAGVVVLVAGFWASSPAWVAAGGLLVAGSALAMVGLLLRLALRRRRWPATASGVLLSAAHLVFAVLWGALMAVNWNRPFWPALYTYAGIGVHAALGLVGWFVQLVVSVSYYLLPRFTGVRSVPDRHLVVLLALLNAAVLLFGAAAALHHPGPARLAAALLSSAGLLYVRDLYRFLAGARQNTPDLTNWHWWAIAGQTLLAAAVAAWWALGMLALDGRRVAAALAVLLLCGWVTLAIMGQLYKVTPFLMWYYRYARGLSAYEVPRLPAPYFPRWGVVAFVLTASGSTALAAAVLVASPPAARAAAVLFASGCTVYAAGLAVSWLLAVLLRGAE